MKIGIFFHSAVGSTKIIAKLFKKALNQNEHTATLHEFEKITDISIVNDYDLLLFGSPVYHGDISHVVEKFIDKIPTLENKKVFLFLSCGLYPANCLGNFSRRIQDKKGSVIGGDWFKMPASDSAIIFPYLKYFLKPAKNVRQKIDKNVTYITGNNISKKQALKIKKYNLYGFLNLPNEKLAKRFKRTIAVDKSTCITCNKCIIGCPLDCYDTDEFGYPIFNKKDCENCYRCIHTCPVQALSINKKKIVPLNYKFFRTIWNELTQ